MVKWVEVGVCGVGFRMHVLNKSHTALQKQDRQRFEGSGSGVGVVFGPGRGSHARGATAPPELRARKPTTPPPTPPPGLVFSI